MSSFLTSIGAGGFFRAHATHNSVSGNASSRAAAIACPHIRHNFSGPAAPASRSSNFRAAIPTSNRKPSAPPQSANKQRAAHEGGAVDRAGS